MTKYLLTVFEVREGSDDPRAVEGGGGPSKRLLEVKAFNSNWLAEACKRGMANRYCDDFRFVLKNT